MHSLQEYDRQRSEVDWEDAVAQNADALEEGDVSTKELAVKGDNESPSPHDDEDDSEGFALCISSRVLVSIPKLRVLHRNEQLQGEEEAKDERTPQVPVAEFLDGSVIGF